MSKSVAECRCLHKSARWADRQGGQASSNAVGEPDVEHLSHQLELVFEGIQFHFFLRLKEYLRANSMLGQILDKTHQKKQSLHVLRSASKSPAPCWRTFDTRRRISGMQYVVDMHHKICARNNG